MNNNQLDINTIKKIVLWGFVAIFIAISVWFLLTHSWVTITTNTSGATIVVTTSSDDNVYKSTTEDYRGFLPLGEYFVSASYDRSTVSQKMTVARFSSLHTTLEIPQSNSPSPITNIDAIDAANTPEGFFFIDRPSGTLMKIDKDNQLSSLTTMYDVRQLMWSSTGPTAVGIAESGVTGKFVLVRLDKGVLSIHPLPNDQSSQIDIAVSETTIFLRQDSALYTSPLSKTDFTLNSELTGESSLLAAHDSTVALSQVEDDTTQKLIFFDTTTQEVSEVPVVYNESPTYFTTVNWSQNGKFIAITSSGNVTVYNSSLENLYTAPEHDVNLTYWRGTSDRLIYASAEKLYQYNPTEKIASSFSSLAPSYVLSSIYPDFVGDDIYYTAVSGGNATLYRTKDTAADNITADTLAGSNMQQLSASCRTYYINYGKLTAIVIGTDETEDACVDEIHSYYRSIGLNPDDIPLQYVDHEMFVEKDTTRNNY